MPGLVNTFLFIEPMQHYLNFGSVVLHQIIEASKRTGQTITELIGNDAYPDNVLQKLQALQPIVVCGIGHGNVNVYSVESTNILVKDDSPELELFESRIISLCSCLTAQILGPAIIDAGAVAYTGYKEEFWFYIGGDPGANHAVQSPFLAEFAFVGSLLQGRTTGLAREDQLKKYEEEITYWISGDGKDTADASELSRILEMNKSNSVFLGEGGVQPSPSGPTILVAGNAPWAWIGMVGLTSYLIYNELKRKSY